MPFNAETSTYQGALTVRGELVTVDNVDFYDNVTGDLAGRRGRVLGTRALPHGRIVVQAQAPLGELDDYPERLKAMTGGNATYTLELAQYEPVPEPLQRQLCGAFRRSDEED